jgi:MFS family permease
MIAVWVRQTVGGLPRTFWYLWLGTLINRVGIFVLPFLTLYLTEQRGLNPELATAAVSMFGIGSFASQIIGGWLADGWGRRPTMLTSLFVTPFMLLALMTATDYAAIIVCTLLLGLFTDLYRPASAAIITDVVPQADRARAFNLRFWAINLGAAVGLGLGGVLARQNYQLLFIGDAVTTFLFGLVIVCLVRETRPTRSPQPTVGAAPTLPKTFALPAHGERSLMIFTLLFSMVLLVTNSVYHQFDATMALAMTADGLNEVDYGSVSALNGLIIVLISLSLNGLMARYEPFRVLACGLLLIGVGFGLYSIDGGISIYALGLIVVTLGEIISAPLSSIIVADISPLHRRGFYQGVLGAGFGLSAFLGPLVGGIVYHRAGADTLWIACLIACALAALVLLMVVQPFYHRLRACFAA